MTDQPISAVIYDASPEEEGWINIGPRVWQSPEGLTYQFPPGEPERLSVFRRVPPGTILRLPQR